MDTHLTKKQKEKLLQLFLYMFGEMLPIFQKFVKSVKRNIKILEDAAEAFGTFYNNGKSVGSLGDIGCIFFQWQQNITTGNGGAIVSNNRSYVNKCRYFISQATDDNIKYLHNEIGFNYRFSGLNAAFGLGQLKKFKFYMDRKKKIHKIYKDLIDPNSQFFLS